MNLVASLTLELCFDLSQSGAAAPHSKTLRNFAGATCARQRLGVRNASSAFLYCQSRTVPRAFNSPPRLPFDAITGSMTLTTQSGAGAPHSKTLRDFAGAACARQRLGVRNGSSAFNRSMQPLVS